MASATKERMARRGSVMLSTLDRASARTNDAANRARESLQRGRRPDFALLASTAEQWVWLRDVKEGYVAARILHEEGDKVEVEYGVNRNVVVVSASELGPRIVRIDDIVRNHTDDMVRMGDVNEATILHNLRMRFAENFIYTNIGSILVSINPFAYFEHLYTRERVMLHLNNPIGEIAPPHVFQIAAAAFQGVRGEQRNQSIIISGESGAGKTEATKKCLQFFAAAAGSATEGIEDKLLAANPILEAFGNAKTVRNNNSSRFGKWMEVHFNGRAQICACKIINYLLEKSRVVFQAKQERNYHIFYMLAGAAPLALRERFGLARPEAYANINSSGCIVVDGMSDAELFEELMVAFKNVQFKEEEYLALLQIVAAILHLCNVGLVGSPLDSDVAAVEESPATREAVAQASRLLGVEPKDLCNSLKMKLIQGATERMWSPMMPQKAIETRNSMAKAVYGRMFDWLVQRVNRSMDTGLKASVNTIGVLDIFGFEIFENNSFEQMCINYCNEKLQQHFNSFVFKAEERCYISEGIDYTEVKYKDNQDVLDLFEARPAGLLPALDDVCRVPGGTELRYVDTINKMQAASERFKVRPKPASRTVDGVPIASELLFGVQHYAGLVVYNAQNFMDKNKDELLLNVKELLSSSTVPFLRSLFAEGGDSHASPTLSPLLAAAGAGAAGGGARDKLSQAAQFRQQLVSLMDTLNATDPHYIRCIKPNNEKRAGLFDAQICLQQLRYAGVFEAVKIRQLGYPFRFTHAMFFKRYRCCASSAALRNSIKARDMDWRQTSSDLVADLVLLVPQLEGTFKFGKTMVLYRADQHRVLEMIRDSVRENAAAMIARVQRGHRARKIVREALATRETARQAMAARDIVAVESALVQVRALRMRIREEEQLQTLHVRLLEEVACLARLAAVLPLDPVENYDAYEACLKEAERLELTSAPQTTQVQRKFNTVRERREAMNNLRTGIERGDKALINASLTRAAELKREWGDVITPELQRAATEALRTIEREETVLNQLRRCLGEGRLSGAVGALNVRDTDAGVLDATITEVLGGSMRITTEVGRCLISTAQRVRDMRVAFKGGDWSAIEMTVGALASEREAERLAPEATLEADLAMAEVRDRRIVRVLSAAIATGAAPGHTGELNMAACDVAGLQTSINAVTAGPTGSIAMSIDALRMLTCAKLILRLRQAMVAADWSGIRKAVTEALDSHLPSQCMPEVYAAKDEHENHSIVHQLTDALERGHVVGTVAALDVRAVDTNLLQERIAFAEELGPKTMKANHLLQLAHIVLQLRTALLASDYTSILELSRQAANIPSDTVPLAAADELLLVQYEAENNLIIAQLREALLTGGAAGALGNTSRAGISVVQLQAAVRKCATWKCRCLEALWLQDVAEALMAVRSAFKENAWHALQEAILAVRALDRARPTRILPAADMPPVLKEKSRAAAGRGSIFFDATATAATSTLPAGASGSGGSAPPSLRRASLLSRDMSPTTITSLANMDVNRGIAELIVGDTIIVEESIVLKALQLPRPVVDELNLMQDELDNYNLLRDLTSVLQTGGPVGEPGALDSRPVHVDDLELALRRHDRLGNIKTPLAASLIYTGRVIRDLRRALLDGNWSVVESVLTIVAQNNAKIVRFAAASNPALAGAVTATRIATSALGIVEVPPFAEDPVVLEFAFFTLAQPGMPEVVRVEQECEYRRVIDLMLAALQCDGPVAGTNHIDCSGVGVAKIAAAIDASRALGSNTVVNQHLTTLCRLMWQLRTAILENDWASVESLLAASQEVTGKTTPLPPGCTVPAYLTRELELYRFEANTRRLKSALMAALQTGGALGEIGRLDIVGISVHGLEEALRLALRLHPQTPETKALAATALQVRSLRLALMGGQWERLGELLDYVHVAVEVNQPFVVNANHDGPIAPDLHKPVMMNTTEGKGMVASWPGVLESNPLFDVGIQGVAPIAASELNTLQLELNNRNAIVNLTNAIVKGAAKGTTGHLDLTSVDTSELEVAIDFATRIGCVTADAQQLLATAHVVHKIRIALLAGDWSLLEAALLEAQGQVLAELGAPEVLAAQDELNNRAILTELTNALSQGQPQGHTGQLFLGALSVEPLNEAIAMSARLVPKTVEAKQMLFTAKVVLRLRMCLQNADLSEAAITLEAVRGKLLASAAMAEVRLVQDEVDNWQVVNELMASIASNCVVGAPGALDISGLSVDALAAAIDKAEELGMKTSEASVLCACAQRLYRLRTAVLRNTWNLPAPDSVEAILQEQRLEKPHELAAAEMSLLQDEVENRHMVVSLSKALALGAARGGVGELDVACIDVSELDTAIADALQLGPKTDDAERLLSAAKLIRRLRGVLMAGNWQWVATVLAEARDAKQIFPPVSLRELQAAQDELDNRTLVSTLVSALSRGGAATTIGDVNAGGIQLAAIDEALAQARAVGVKSAEATQLVMTAHMIRGIRAALKAGNFEEARTLLEGMEGNVLASQAADEVQFARLHVDNWSIIAELTAALGAGSHEGVLGELNAHTVQIARLDVAISHALEGGCHTVEARHLLASALLVRRLRGALLDANYAQLESVLAEAAREPAVLVPRVEAELRDARALLAFREAMASLSAALEAQDEGKLVDALARAARLGLADHPTASVRSLVETATLTLGRIQRCKASLAAAIKSLDAVLLIDALTTASTMSFVHPLVDEARRVLSTVQALAERAASALAAMDAVEMQAALRDCEVMGLSLPVLNDLRRMLALPRAEFLRRELATILSNAAASGAAAVGAAHPRAPTPMESHVIMCTLQLKDHFFAELSSSDDAAAAAAEPGVVQASDAVLASVPGSPGVRRAPPPPPSAAASARTPAAAPGQVVMTLRGQLNCKENVRGCALRAQSVRQLGGLAWAFVPSPAPTAGGGASFKPGGSAPLQGVSAVGVAVPAPHSRLRRQFELARLPSLKPAHMFSRKYSLSESAEATLLRWQHEPIHTSLTLLQDAEVRRLAVKAFRDILAFMGDRPLARPIHLAQEVLAVAAVTPALRDEFYVQLCKQLTGNPSAASMERGWVLMHAALCTFPPSEELENYLELFLRDHGALPCVWALHLTLFRGGAGMAGAPSAEELSQALERAGAPALPSLSFDIAAGSDAHAHAHAASGSGADVVLALASPRSTAAAASMTRF